MKRILLLIMFSITVLMGWSQVKESGDFQIGGFGGASFPMGSYKSIGQTKTGYFGGLFADKYFTGNRFGIGVDARYLTHGMHREDSVFFANGYIATDYVNAPKFKHWAFTLGPSYKFRSGRFHAEAYLRGGVLLQHFPQYERTLSFNTGAGGGMTHVPIKRTMNDSTNKANAWVGLGGLRFNYNLSPNFAVFVQADYMQSFGTKFAGKPSEFYIEEREAAGTGTVWGEKTEVREWTQYYSDVFTQQKTPYKSLNVGVGVKYTFGKKKVKTPPVSPAPVEQYVAEKKSSPKAIQIVVKDKQTGLALSGVTVSVESAVYNTKENSDVQGEISRIVDAQVAEYKIVGEKNGIKTDVLTLTEADFAGNEAIIYRELLHDDPRFTLIGETVDCETENTISGIATVLTQTENKQNMSQTTDAEGKFIYQLDQDAEYAVVANQAGRYSQTELVSTRGLDRSKTLYVTLKLGVCHLIEGGNWVLKNIHYDFDKWNIRPDAAIILDNVVAVLKQNPTLRIELSSHTDSRGNDSYNMRLSQRRAESAVSYLVRNGIDRSRLEAKGYGESRLLNDCGNGIPCSEEQHQENRRTEINVLQYK